MITVPRPRTPPPSPHNLLQYIHSVRTNGVLHGFVRHALCGHSSAQVSSKGYGKRRYLHCCRLQSSQLPMVRNRRYLLGGEDFGGWRVLWANEQRTGARAIKQRKRHKLPRRTSSQFRNENSLPRHHPLTLPWLQRMRQSDTPCRRPSPNVVTSAVNRAQQQTKQLPKRKKLQSPRQPAPHRPNCRKDRHAGPSHPQASLSPIPAHTLRLLYTAAH